MDDVRKVAGGGVVLICPVNLGTTQTRGKGGRLCMTPWQRGPNDQLIRKERQRPKEKGDSLFIIEHFWFMHIIWRFWGKKGNRQGGWRLKTGRIYIGIHHARPWYLFNMERTASSDVAKAKGSEREVGCISTKAFYVGSTPRA